MKPFYSTLGSNQKTNLVFNLDELSLNYKIKLHPNEVYWLVKNVDTKSNIEQDKIINLIEEIENIVPRRQYAPNNPNNGDFAYYYEFGREYSRVIYLHVEKKFVNNMSSGCFELYMKKCAESAETNEFSFEENDVFYTMRFWWD